jgi:hypothetical protein
MATLTALLTSPWFIQIALYIIGKMIGWGVLRSQDRTEFINFVNALRDRGLSDVKTRYSAEGQLERVDQMWNEIEKKEIENGKQK